MCFQSTKSNKTFRIFLSIWYHQFCFDVCINTYAVAFDGNATLGYHKCKLFILYIHIKDTMKAFLTNWKAVVGTFTARQICGMSDVVALYRGHFCVFSLPELNCAQSARDELLLTLDVQHPGCCSWVPQQ